MAQPVVTKIAQGDTAKSTIMPSVTVEIPMPPGIAVPAQPVSAPPSMSPAAPNPAPDVAPE